MAVEPIRDRVVQVSVSAQNMLCRGVTSVSWMTLSSTRIALKRPPPQIPDNGRERGVGGLHREANESGFTRSPIGESWGRSAPETLRAPPTVVSGQALMPTTIRCDGAGSRFWAASCQVPAHRTTGRRWSWSCHLPAPRPGRATTTGQAPLPIFADAKAKFKAAWARRWA